MRTQIILPGVSLARTIAQSVFYSPPFHERFSPRIQRPGQTFSFASFTERQYRVDEALANRRQKFLVDCKYPRRLPLERCG